MINLITLPFVCIDIVADAGGTVDKQRPYLGKLRNNLRELIINVECNIIILLIYFINIILINKILNYTSFIFNLNI